MKNNGRFLPFTIFHSLFNSAMPRFFDDGADGGSSDVDKLFGEEAPPDTGNPDTPAPDVAADESTPPAEGKTEPETDGSPQGQADEIDEDEFSQSLKLGETPEAEKERITREHKAASSEARKQSARVKSLTKRLEAQGLKVLYGDNDEVDLVQTEKYSDKGVAPEVKLSELNADDIEAFESGDIETIQPVIDKLLAQQKTSLIRALPTLDKEPKGISDEQKSSVFDHMSQAVDLNESPKYENLSKNQKHIEALVDDPALNGVLKAAFAESPEVIAAIVNDHINVQRAKFVAKNAAAKAALNKKETDAVRAAQVNVNSSSAPGKASAGAEAVLDFLGPKR